MIFARCVFLFAGTFGLLALLPMYFLESRIGRDQPPAISHPEYFYGFLGVAVSWQVAFLVIAGDLLRFRPLMVLAVLEKAAFGLAVVALFLGLRVLAVMLIFGLIDLTLGALFLVALSAETQSVSKDGSGPEDRRVVFSHGGRMACPSLPVPYEGNSRTLWDILGEMASNTPADRDHGICRGLFLAKGGTLKS